MNDRVMQFRIGMFVIASGMVLTMLIVWFEAPALIQERRYVTVFFPEAPGVDRGIPVRKSGVRVGEVFSFTFTEADQPEGVLVTLSLDPAYSIRAGTVPRLGRALIGDVAIDLLPGSGTETGPITAYDSPEESARPGRWVEGVVATDPFLLLTDASKIVERADSTMVAIEAAATNLSEVVGKADKLEEFLETWGRTGESVEAVASDLGRVLRENESEIKPTVATIRSVAEKFDAAFDAETQDQFKRTLATVSSASQRLDAVLADLQPVAAELKLGPTDTPRTNLGQILLRTNRIAYDVGVLTAHLHDGKGRLNTRGTLQRLISDPQLYDDLMLVLRSADATVNDARAVLRTFGSFADRINRDPGLITTGVLNGR
ncbi:MlaD family protein [Tautonia sociabilis]|uniref:MCE family protein n=1 Tax=Tautonia sociabilis TaxID=2080755 RepID=A0A432MPQ9_9BACT|nr:MlaD family protein [Tautonia sociabilis]RUL89147.1 MCE family protein [Tautonia sociabilis]